MKLEITSADRLEQLIQEFPAAAVFFSGPLCGICHAVEPRIEALMESAFPRMGYLHVDTEKLPDAAARHQVFTIPTLIIFFEGGESRRFVRAFGVGEVREFVERQYMLLFTSLDED